jgi:hypothetical protein
MGRNTDLAAASQLPASGVPVSSFEVSATLPSAPSERAGLAEGCSRGRGELREPHGSSWLVGLRHGDP